MTIQLVTTKKVNETVDVRYPSFYQQDNRCVGFFDVDTVIKFFNTGDYTSMQVGTAEFFSNEIIEAHNAFNEIGRQAFDIELAKALKNFSGQKREITTAELNEPF